MSFQNCGAEPTSEAVAIPHREGGRGPLMDTPSRLFLSTRETPDLPHRTPSRVEPFPESTSPPAMCPPVTGTVVRSPSIRNGLRVDSGNLSGSQRRRGPFPLWTTATPRQLFRNA